MKLFFFFFFSIRNETFICFKYLFSVVTELLDVTGRYLYKPVTRNCYVWLVSISIGAKSISSSVNSVLRELNFAYSASFDRSGEN